MKKLKLPVLLALIAGSLLFTLVPWFSKFTGIAIGAHRFRFDYLFHFSMNGVLILSLYAWYVTRGITRFRTFLLFISLGIAFSFLVEILQIPIPKRNFNYVDFVFSTFGVLVGSLSFWLYQRFIPQLEIKNPK